MARSNKLRIVRILILGVVFGMVGPAISLMTSDTDSLDADFFAYLDAYFWPTHFFAWGPGGWGVFSYCANVIFFVFTALGANQFAKLDKGQWILLLTGTIWSVFLTLFLAGFQIEEVHLASAFAGFFFYISFASIILFLSRVGASDT